MGLIAAAVVAAVAVFILVFGRVGVLHGKKFTLYITTDGARGVIRGTDVWLDGQKVGLVSNVQFRPPSVAPSERLVLTLSVLTNARIRIRGNTRVQVRSGGTILGDQVVSLSSGTPAAPEMTDGDTIHAGSAVDLEGMTSDAALASREFPGIIENVKLLGAQLRGAQGTLAAFGIERGGANLERTEHDVNRLLAMMKDSNGTVGLALAARNKEGKPAAGNASPIDALATHAMAAMDSIRTLLGSNRHSLGRFRRDSTLTHELTRVRGELEHVKTLASTPSGTIGRLRTDSTLIRSVNGDLTALDSLESNIKKHPLRYIAF